MADNQPDNGSNNWAAGDSGTAKDVLEIPTERVFTIGDYVIGYASAGTQYAEVEFYDAEAGTAAGNLSNPFDTVLVSAGDTVPITGIDRDDVDQDIVAIVNNNDDRVRVSVGGEVRTP